jgi:hypothetical protein
VLPRKRGWLMVFVGKAAFLVPFRNGETVVFWLAALAGALAAGCTLPGKNACAASDGCLDGYECVDGQCVRTPTGSSRCDPSMPFAPAMLVPGLNRNPGMEYRVNVSPDELTAYVSSGSTWWQSDLFVSTRASRADLFGPLVPLPTLDVGHEVSISVTADGLTAFFDRADLNGRIFAATRTTIDQPFGTPGPVILDPSMPQEYDPYVLPDESALYFTAVLDPSTSATPTGILRTALDADPPALLLLGMTARFPVVSADELTLYLSAPSSPGSDDFDIWITTRPTRSAPFAAPTKVDELNTSTTEGPQWISPDGCRLYFTRTYAPDGSQAFSFVAERAPPAAHSP